MKKILIGLVFAFTIMGCTQTSSYERNTNMGLIKNVTFEEVKEKIENKETFMFAFTMEECSACLWFKENVLSKYLKNHGFIFHEVFVEKETDSQLLFDFTASLSNNEDFIDDNGPTIPTPTFFFVEKGIVKEWLIGSNVHEKDFDYLIQKYQLDKIVE